MLGLDRVLLHVYLDLLLLATDRVSVGKCQMNLLILRAIRTLNWMQH